MALLPWSSDQARNKALGSLLKIDLIALGPKACLMQLFLSFISLKARASQTKKFVQRQYANEIFPPLSEYRTSSYT